MKNVHFDSPLPPSAIAELDQNWARGVEFFSNLNKEQTVAVMELTILLMQDPDKFLDELYENRDSGTARYFLNILTCGMAELMYRHDQQEVEDGVA